MITCLKFTDTHSQYDFSLADKEQFKNRFSHGPYGRMKEHITEINIDDIVPHEDDSYYVWEYINNEFDFYLWAGTFVELRKHLLIMELAGL